VADQKFREAPGTFEKVQPVATYKDWILQRWKHLAQARALDVVLDAGNGAWSEIAPDVFEKVGFRVHRLFCEIDGTFPNRIPDCARPGALSALQREIKNTRASLGVAWDGDGDRVAFVDEAGSVVSADEASVLLVRHLLREQAVARVVLDIKLSDKVRRTVLECGGVPLIERSGHTFIKRRMMQENCLLGCEMSGHYFYDNLHGGDDGLFSALLLVEVISRTAPLGDLRKLLGPLFLTPDLRLPSSILPYEEAIRRLRAAFNIANKVRVDGVRIETAEGFVLARESVTEPVLTMRLEGHTEESQAH
jgi:phosphomannomutase